MAGNEVIVGWIVGKRMYIMGLLLLPSVKMLVDWKEGGYTHNQRGAAGKCRKEWYDCDGSAA
jgi:hypothetical protein